MTQIKFSDFSLTLKEFFWTYGSHKWLTNPEEGQAAQGTTMKRVQHSQQPMDRIHNVGDHSCIVTYPV